MGTVYCGPPYADVIGYDDHEGYAARVLPDGTETGTWTYATRQFSGYRAWCACGWRGSALYPPTDAGERGAEDEWDRDHVQPLLHAEAQRHMIRADVLLAFVRDLRSSVRPGPNLTARGRGVLDAADRLCVLLDHLAQGDTP
ncbi:MAG: hypothetical protein ACJ72N_24005 [Labedaea sp.]